jgi:hypothetical protein
MSHRQEINAILKLVAGWPTAEREALAKEIVSSPSALPPPPRDTYRRALGIGRGEGPPPSDEDVRRIIHEHRMAKYG